MRLDNSLNNKNEVNIFSSFQIHQETYTKKEKKLVNVCTFHVSCVYFHMLFIILMLFILHKNLFIYGAISISFAIIFHLYVYMIKYYVYVMVIWIQLIDYENTSLMKGLGTPQKGHSQDRHT